MKKKLLSILSIMMILALSLSNLTSFGVNAIDANNDVSQNTEISETDGEKKVKEIEYAENFTADLQNILIGGVANTPGEPVTVNSGTSVTTMVVFTINAPDGVIEKEKVAGRVKIPKSATLQFPATDSIFKMGSASDPEGTPVEDDEFQYLWIIHSKDSNSADTVTLNFIVNAFKNGVTDDETECEMEVAVYNLNTMKVVSQVRKNSIFANTDQFSWNTANVTKGHGNLATNPSNYVIGNIEYNIATSTRTGSVNNAVGYAKSVTFESEYSLPMDSSPNEKIPLIILDKSNIVNKDGSAIPEQDIDLILNDTGAVVGFKVRQTVTNPDTTKELTNPNVSFVIKGATVNSAAPSITSINASANAGSIGMNITHVGSTGIVTSSVKLDSGKFEENNFAISSNRVANTPVTFSKGAEETGNESYIAPRKTVSTINSTKINSEHPTGTSGFVGDSVTFELGAEKFKNTQTTNFKLLQYKEVEGSDGFDIKKILPLSIGMGTVSNFTEGTITAIVEFKSGAPLTHVFTPNDTLTGFEIPEASRSNVKSITFKYENVNSGFSITGGPTIKYRVLNQYDLNANGKRVTNTVQTVYDSGNKLAEPKNGTATSSFRYQLYPSNSSGMFSNDKNGVNLANSSQTLPKPGEVVMFTIKLDNFDTKPMLINLIKDQYTSDYLKAYSGTKTTLTGTTEIDAKYISSNDMNIQVWHEDPKLASSSPVATSGIHVIDDGNGNIDIEFDSVITVPANKTYYITYTMSVTYQMTADTTLGNAFESYYNSDPVADGMFFWGPAIGDGKDRSSKGHYNISGYSKEGNTAVNGIKPYSGDVVLFKLTVINPTETDWDGKVSPIVITDTYNQNYKAHSGSNSINPAVIPAGITLDYDKPLNLSYVTGGTTIASFDPDEMTINVNEQSNKITINLGNTVIEAGKKVELVYTLKVVDSVKAGDSLVNEFKIDYNKDTVGIGTDTWEVNASQSKVGMVNIAKSAASAADNGNVNTRLMNNDVIEYTVTLQNFHIRANRSAILKNFVDTLPSNMFYVPGSVSFKYISTKDGVSEELELPNGAKNSTITSDNDHIYVNLSEPVPLVSPDYNGTFGEVTTYKLVMTYKLKVNTISPEIGAGVLSKAQKNTIGAYFTNPQSELFYATSTNGTVNTTKAVDVDNANEDNDDTTLTKFTTDASVTVINDQNNFVALSKATNIASYNIDTVTTGRTYTIYITNTGRNDFNINKFVDILPKYEALVPDSLYIEYADGLKIKPSVTTDTFTNSEGNQYQRITSADSVTIQAPTQASEVNRVTKIVYNTSIDTGILKALMIEQQNNYTAQTNYFAFYIPEDTLVYGVSPQDDSLPINNDWDNDPTTTKRYAATTAVTYVANQIAPVVDIKTQMIYRNTHGVESYTNYNPSVDFISPNDYIAYNIRFGNTNLTNTAAIQAGSRIVLVLPDGLTLAGYDLDATGAEKNYPFLDDYETTTDSKGNQVITWVVNTAINPNVIQTFRVRVHAENYKYTTYRPQVYFVPNQNDVQEFFDTPLSASQAYRDYGYTIHHKDISDLLDDLAGESHYVSDSEFVDVYGMLGVSAQQFEKEVVTSNSVSSRDSDTELVLTDKENVIEYQLNITSVKGETIIQDISIINRLPSIGDIANVGVRERGSEANIRLVGDGNFSATLKFDKDTAETTIDPDKYTVYYFFGDPDEQFTKADYDAGYVAGRWIAKDSAEAPSITDWNEATAFKVKFDSTISVGGLGNINVFFDGQLSDYNVGGLSAKNSFGYYGKIGNGKFELLTEVLAVEVSADILLDRVKITKNLVDTDTNPLKKEFKFTLTGYDDQGNVEYDNPEIISVVVRKDDELGWIGSEWVYELPLGLKYVITEVSEPNFATPVITSDSKTFSDTTTEWQFTVTNTRVKQEFKVTKSWVNFNNVTLDATTFSNVVVYLVDKKNPTVNLASVTLNNANDWTASFGEFNLYEEALDENDKPIAIEYEIKEVNVAGYTSTWSLNGATYTFSLQNKENPGSVVLKKTDALDTTKTLSGVVFELYTAADVKVGTTYTTDADGQITVNNLPSGTYYFKEVQAKAGYVLDATHRTFTIVVNQQTPTTVNVGNSMTPGKVKLIKKNINDSLLENAVFELYNDKDVLLGEYTTNSDGEINVSNLAVGEYYFVEKSAPTGYVLDTTHREFEVVFNQQTAVTVSVVNQMTPGAVKLVKTNIHDALLENAVFELYSDKDVLLGEYTTNSDGEINVSNLAVGEYYFVEKTAPTGYVLDTTHREFEVVFNQQTAVTVSVVNQMTPGAVKLVKTNIHDALLENAVFEIYDIEDVLIGEYTTNSDGEITVGNLPVGEYYFVEKSAPTGYELDETHYEFEIEFNQQEATSFNVVNQMTPGSVTLVKTNINGTFLKDVVFELYTKDGQLIGEYTTDKDGSISVNNLPVGAYYFVEKTALPGYDIDFNHYEFVIEFNQQTSAMVRVLNNMTPGGVILNKVNAKHEGLQGAVFGLYTQEGVLIKEFTTDANGMIRIDGLEVGSYTFKELKAPEGYTLDETPINFNVEFNQDGILQLTMLNNATPPLPSTGVASHQNNYYLMMALGVLMVAVGQIDPKKLKKKAK